MHKNNKPLDVNPLKKGQTMGATLAYLGIHKCMPLIHGSQGCMAFIKNMLTQHFREIIPMQSTAVSDIAVILGTNENIHTALKNIIEKHSPEAVGIINSAMTSVRGDDIKKDIASFHENYNDLKDTMIFFTDTPDFKGDMETGYATTVLNIIKQSDIQMQPKNEKCINVIPGLHQSAADIDWLKSLLHSMGIKPLIVPNFQQSLSGETESFYTLPETTATTKLINNMSCASGTLVFGKSLEMCGKYLEEHFGIPFLTVKNSVGIIPTDNIIEWIMRVTNTDFVPKWIKIQRNKAVDAIADAHFYLTGKKCSIAIEPDALASLSYFLTKELGVNIETVVTTYDSEHLDDIDAEKGIIGDLEDFEKNISESSFILTNSHGDGIAANLGTIIYHVGLPIKTELGHFHRHTIGYLGAMGLAFDFGNICLKEEESLYQAKNIKEGSYEDWILQ